VVPPLQHPLHPLDVLQTQWLPWHIVPVAHWLPHEPQLLLSLV
jgi:hypothetical protein